MNLAWILQGIRQVRESTPVQASMDAVYSLIKNDENDSYTETNRPKRKRHRDDEDDSEYMSEYQSSAKRFK